MLIFLENQRFLDKLIGGVGLRRGRRNQNELEAGDSVDFGAFYMPTKKKNAFTLRRNESSWRSLVRILY